MKFTSGLGWSKKHDWETPRHIYDKLHKEFIFTLDAAASAKNAKCKKYFTLQDNALCQRWIGTVWCNPPYGRAIKDFVKKAYQESKMGAIVVMLIPSRTDTAWWHDWVMMAHEIRLIRGRLKFGDGPSTAPFPSAIVIFRPDSNGKPKLTNMDGRP